MNQTLHIVGQTFRRLRARPLYTSMIVLCLALGIGANSAIFSIVNTLLLHPLVVHDIDRLVFTLDMRNGDDPFEASGVDYVAFKKANAFESVGVGRRQSFRLLGNDRPEQLEGAAIAEDYFKTLDVKPVVGRLFTAEEDRPGAGSVALISYEFWQSHFGGQNSVIGQNVRLNNGIYELIGVMPKGFDLPLGTAVWVPLATNVEALPVVENTRHNMFLVGRLKPGVSHEQASAEVQSIATRLQADYPAQRQGWTLRLIPLRQQILGDITGHLRPAIYLLVFVVGFLLLITCANVANLLLVRSLERSHEIALQIALGARKRRLVMQLLTESIMLAVAGGAAGLLLARFGAFLFATFRPISTFSLKSILEHVEIDSHVMLFTFAISLATGILFGLAPMFHASLPGGLILHLREGGQRGSGGSGRRLLNVLVVGEVVMAVVLLIGAGLMIKNLQELQNAKLGFRTDHVLSVHMYLSQEDYPTHTQRAEFVKNLVERVSSAPGVLSAAVTTNIPLSLSGRPGDLAGGGCQQGLCAAGVAE
jgi:putative ABC transport system permease protein